MSKIRSKWSKWPKNDTVLDTPPKKALFRDFPGNNFCRKFSEIFRNFPESALQKRAKFGKTKFPGISGKSRCKIVHFCARPFFAINFFRKSRDRLPGRGWQFWPEIFDLSFSKKRHSFDTFFNKNRVFCMFFSRNFPEFFGFVKPRAFRNFWAVFNYKIFFFCWKFVEIPEKPIFRNFGTGRGSAERQNGHFPVTFFPLFWHFFRNFTNFVHFRDRGDFPQFSGVFRGFQFLINYKMHKKG